ncbi:hypothetical protein [Halomonas sp. TD01]|uniref:hypothetical protein n=1 Tax=Halomonas sp. TD01 TaxID=999141 RepID=UPI000214D522|nr:hypothetical protein [Halomonas sp. TD01]EGP19976.1 hypothetical protein GME_08939 [Halomonas sp. TD01]CAH1042994.1 hypothetical protein HPTD01_1472 [Halomonas sp. TD01]
MYFKALFTAGVISLFSLPTSAFAQAACQDDERLYSFADYVDERQAGTSEPLQLTVATFLNLTPRARDVIGDNLRLLDSECRPMQVSQGEPPFRIEMPFSTLYMGFYDAVLRGDERTQQILLNSFRAEPVDPMEFISYFTVIDSGNEELMERLARSAGINIHTASCDAETKYLHFADLFVRFGGSVYGEHGKAWFVSGGRGLISSVDTELSQIFTPLNGSYCKVSKNSVLSVAEAAGAITFNIGTHSQDILSARGSHFIQKHQEWLELGAPDAVPASLFD